MDNLQFLKPGEEAKTKNQGLTRIEDLFTNPVRFGLMEKTNGADFDGVRAVYNFGGVPLYPQSKPLDPIKRASLKGVAQWLQLATGLTYAGKSVAFVRLLRNLDIVTNRAKDQALFAIDFMFL